MDCSICTAKLGDRWYWTCLGPLGSLLGFSGPGSDKLTPHGQGGLYETEGDARKAGEAWLRSYRRLN